MSRIVIGQEKSLVADALLPLLLCLGCAVVPIGMLSRITDQNFSALVLTILAVYSGARLSIIGLNGRGRIMQLFFWFYFYFFLALAPLAQLSGSWPWPAVVSDREILIATIIVSSAAVSYEITRIIAENAQKRRIGVLLPSRTLSISRLTLIVPAMTVTSLAIMVTLGGPISLLQTRDSRFLTISAVGASNASIGLISTALVSTAFVSAYLMVVARRQKLIQGWAIPTIVLVLLALFVTNPLSTNRYTLISVWAGIFLAYLWPLNRRTFAVITAGMIVGLAIVFPWLNQFRRASSRSSIAGDLHAMLNHGDYDSFQQITSVVAYVTDQGHTWGHQLSSALLFWVPRSVWSGKSIDTGVLAARHEGYDFVNLSSPLPSEAYVDFGIPGVVILFGALGGITVWAERRAADLQTLTTFTGLFVPIFAVYQVIILRGSLLQAVGSIAVVASLLFFATKRGMPEVLGGPPILKHR